MSNYDGFWTFVLVLWWMLGIAVAKGAWWIFGASCFPPLAFVLFAKYVLGIE